MARVTMRVERKSTGVLEKVAKMFGRRDPNKVKVGFPSGKSDAESIMKAIYNEFGTRGSGKGFKTKRGGGFGGPIPERPFLRNTMRNKRNAYTRAMSEAAPKILRAETTIPAVLVNLGGLAQGDIQNEITALSTPPNSPVTVALKGSSNPLMDTGRMRRDVQWKLDR